MVTDDRHLTVNQIACAISISCKTVGDLVHIELGMMKVSACWVPCLLTPDQKCTRLISSQKIWHCLRQIQLDFKKIFPYSKWILSWSYWTRDKETICAVGTPFHLLQKLFRLQGGWWLQLFEMQKDLCSLIVFRKATESMESSMPICWSFMKGCQNETHKETYERGLISLGECSNTWVFAFKGYCTWPWLWTDWSASLLSTCLCLWQHSPGVGWTAPSEFAASVNSLKCHGMYKSLRK